VAFKANCQSSSKALQKVKLIFWIYTKHQEQPNTCLTNNSLTKVVAKMSSWLTVRMKTMFILKLKITKRVKLLTEKEFKKPLFLIQKSLLKKGTWLLINLKVRQALFLKGT